MRKRKAPFLLSLNEGCLCVGVGGRREKGLSRVPGSFCSSVLCFSSCCSPRNPQQMEVKVEDLTYQNP